MTLNVRTRLNLTESLSRPRLGVAVTGGRRGGARRFRLPHGPGRHREKRSRHSEIFPSLQA